jgi:hypothetical protein
MVPAMPRFPGVMNDLKVRQALGELPLEQVRAPTLIVGSRYDGDIGYDNSVNSGASISGSTLITVEQFGHFIWRGDADVTRNFERRIEDFLARHVRPLGLRGQPQAPTRRDRASVPVARCAAAGRRAAGPRAVIVRPA